MSPSSRGILAGLLLAAPVLLSTLSVNEGWLLPAVDETGVAYLIAAPQLAAGEAVALPWAAWTSDDPETPFAGRAPLTPSVMAQLLPIRPQPHVAALWTLAGSAGLLVLLLAWTAGGAGGIGAAFLAGAGLITVGAGTGLVTAIRPEVLAMVFVALQMGIMTYQPRWNAAHGAAAAGAWLAHPAGIGAVAAALLWASLRRGPAQARLLRSVLALAIPAALFLFGSGAAATTLPDRISHPDGFAVGIGAAIGGFLNGIGGGWGVASILLALPLLGGSALLVVLDFFETPTPRDDVHWKDPAAMDALANAMRPAALLLFLSIGAAALLGFGAGYGSMTAPWALALVPFVGVTAVSAVRVAARSAAQPRGRAVIYGTTALWLVIVTVGAGRTLGLHTDEGRALTHRSWVSSEVIRWVDNRSDPWPVLYSDQPALLQIQSGRASDRLPVEDAEIADFAAVFRGRPGAIVLTNTSDLSLAGLLETLPVRVEVETALGRVLVPN